MTSEIQRSITQSFQKDSLISFLIVCCSSRPHHLVKTSSNAVKAWIILSRPGLDIGWQSSDEWESSEILIQLTRLRNSSSDIPRLHLCLMRLQCVVHVLSARSKSLFIFIFIFLISYWSFAWVTLPPGRNSRKWSGCFADEVFEGRNDIKKTKKNCMAYQLLFFIV